ncbi:MAG TPA: hypothetical protein PKW95_09640 [bacterium]|nr:hypothetical protein [bacterium]
MPSKDEGDWFTRGIAVLVKGPAGLGKSTLALEILSNMFIPEKKEAAQNKGVCVYYSLEQTISVLVQNAGSLLQRDKLQFRPLEEIILSAPDSKSVYDEKSARRKFFNELIKSSKRERTVIFPRLSPRFIMESEQGDENVFWQRYKQIARMIEESSQEGNRILALALDNINVFTNDPLNREQVYRLFNLLAGNIPLSILLCEEDNHSPTERNHLVPDAEFLADIIIEFAWDVRNDYKIKTIQLQKNRYQRHVLGRHPFKIRKPPEPEKKGGKREPAVNIYLSMHHQIILAKRQQTEEQKSSRLISFGIQGVDELIDAQKAKRQKRKEVFDYRSCLIIDGERGTHKFAIAINYLFAGLRNGEDALIINLGGEIDMNRLPQEEDRLIVEQVLHKKVEKYVISSYKNIVGKNHIHILTFDPGFLLPEEFMFFVDQFINNHPTIKRVLFNSTVHLPLRFPALYSEQIFLPMLINYLKSKNIGALLISTRNKSVDNDFQFGLNAMADIIITLDLLDRHKNNIQIAPQDEWLLKEFAPHDWLTDLKHKAIVISADNITGKVYEKRWKLVFIKERGEHQNVIKLIDFSIQ